ncbi:MAG: DUF3333 domain-containing protein, partial [Cucumibacter sp.]
MTATSVAAPIGATRAGSASIQRRRNAADLRLRLYGIAAISAAIGLLGILLVTLIVGGYPAFVQTHIRVDFPISAEYVD